MMAEASSNITHSHEKPNFFIRWFMSTNHKDIGILYIFTAALFGFISVAFTVYMRLELMEPGVQYMTLDGQPNGHLVECLDNWTWRIDDVFCCYTCFIWWIWKLFHAFNDRRTRYGFPKNE